MKELQTTLLYLLKDNQILLAMKKRGHGVGKYNGVGGKVDTGETIEQAMVRETQEEIGVTPLKYQKRGQIIFDSYYKGEPALINVHIFTATEFDGEPQESEEMSPAWCEIDQIPYDKMFQTDKIWLPIMLEKSGFLTGIFKFSNDLDSKLLDYKFEIK